MKQKNLRRSLSLFLVLALMLSLAPTVSQAATEAALPAAGGTLLNGRIYRVTANTVLRATTAGQSGLYVAAGATAYLYIAKYVTIAVIGADGSGTTGGGAGINLPVNSTLYVLGGGRLVVIGGASGTPGNGAAGASGYLSVAHNGYGTSVIRLGNGGAGGAGAGGAGAGIGGAGGNGGAGGAGGSSYYGNSNFSGKNDTSPIQGVNGSPGSKGGAGGNMGSLYVMGSVTFDAAAGTVSKTVGIGQSGGTSYIGYPGWMHTAAAMAGAGGGGGGIGGAAAAIGSGGSGGGGGGGGGQGGYLRSNQICYVAHPGGGGGGGSALGVGGTAGGYSTSVNNVDPSWITNSEISHLNGAVAQNGSLIPGTGGGGSITPSAAYYPDSRMPGSVKGSGSGGSGGFPGGSGIHGTVYKTSTASLSGRTANGTVAGNDLPVDVRTTYIFNNNNEHATGGPGTITTALGDTIKTITPPTRTSFAFSGYYTGTDGTGTRYFDHRGESLLNYNQSGTLTLYAHWIQNQFVVTLNKQGGTGGVNFVITVAPTDGTIGGPVPAGPIGIPSRSGHRFLGYYDKVAGDDRVQYYDAFGNRVSTNVISVNQPLYASWEQITYPVVIENAGGTGTTSYRTGENGALSPLPVPTRTGYVFKGYFDAQSGGTQYFDENGAPVSGRTLTGLSNNLYAQWEAASYGISYNLAGGAHAASPAAPTSHLYTENTTIPNPVWHEMTNGIPEMVFTGWTRTGGDAAKRMMDLTIPASNPEWAALVELVATWAPTAVSSISVAEQIAEVTGVLTTNETAIKAELMKVFDYIVTEENKTKGVTIKDMNGTNSVTLTLTVTHADNPTDQASIADMALGTVVSYYDLKVTKTVVPASGGAGETITLTELPVPITVIIDSTQGDLAGMPSFVVYRVHQQVAERLPEIDQAHGEEYYAINGDLITIRTRKFSTYGVMATAKTIENGEGDSYTSFTSGKQTMEVQGRVIEPTPEKIYSLDLTWGPMRFTYSTDKEWNPETHLHSEGAFNDWLPTDFTNGNNAITAVNHSNGNVRVNFSVVTQIANVDMTLHQYSERSAAAAEYFILEKAPIGATAAELETCTAYLILFGPPPKDWLENAVNKTFVKSGVITATVAAHPDA